MTPFKANDQLRVLYSNLLHWKLQHLSVEGGILFIRSSIFFLKPHTITKLPLPVLTAHCSQSWSSTGLGRLLSHTNCSQGNAHPLARHWRLFMNLPPSIFLLPSLSYPVPTVSSVGQIVMTPVFAWCFVTQQTCLCRWFSPFDVLHMHHVFPSPILVKSMGFFLLVDTAYIPRLYLIYLCFAFFCILFHLHPLERKLLQGRKSAHLHLVHARAVHTSRPLIPCTLDRLDFLLQRGRGQKSDKNQEFLILI